MSDKSMADCKQGTCNYAMCAGCAPRILTLFKFSKYQYYKINTVLSSTINTVIPSTIHTELYPVL